MRIPQQLAGAVFAGVVLAGAGVAGPALAATHEQDSPVASPVQTRVESFSMPAKHEIHRDFDAVGTVQELRAGRWRAAASATVVFYYRSLPRGTWIHAGSTRAGSSGRFDWKSGVHKLGKLG